MIYKVSFTLGIDGFTFNSENSERVVKQLSNEIESLLQERLYSAEVNRISHFTNLSVIDGSALSFESLFDIRSRNETDTLVFGPRIGIVKSVDLIIRNGSSSDLYQVLIRVDSIDQNFN